MVIVVHIIVYILKPRKGSSGSQNSTSLVKEHKKSDSSQKDVQAETKALYGQDGLPWENECIERSVKKRKQKKNRKRLRNTKKRSSKAGKRH